MNDAPPKVGPINPWAHPAVMQAAHYTNEKRRIGRPDETYALVEDVSFPVGHPNRWRLAQV